MSYESSQSVIQLSFILRYTIGHEANNSFSLFLVVSLISILKFFVLCIASHNYWVVCFLSHYWGLFWMVYVHCIWPNQKCRMIGNPLAKFEPTCVKMCTWHFQGRIYAVKMWRLCFVRILRGHFYLDILLLVWFCTSNNRPRIQCGRIFFCSY